MLTPCKLKKNQYIMQDTPGPATPYITLTLFQGINDTKNTKNCCNISKKLKVLRKKISLEKQQSL
jgi:hypothetical protein